jgi:rhodanese-related sulfurtransferase
VVVVAAWWIWSRTQQRSEHVSSTTQRIQPRQYQAGYVHDKTPHLLLDVRSPEEFRSGHIKGAVNIDLQVLPKRMAEIPTDKPVVIYCRSGRRSAIAAQMLARAGYPEIYDLGGIIAWQAAGLKLS